MGTLGKIPGGVRANQVPEGRQLDFQDDLMRELFARSITAELRNLTTKLRSLDHALKSNPSLDGPALREFRLALDNVRLTAWTVSELQNARESRKNPQVVISFLTAERLRRFSQIARDLCNDLERESGSWSAQAVNDLTNSLNLLRERLKTVGERE
jgi:hypothetical protein